MKIKILTLIFLFSVFFVLNSIAQQPVEETYAFDKVKELSELNSYGEAEAFPWISPDGLRIYYTKAVNGKERILTASRNLINSKFKNKRVLNLGFEDSSIISCCLSNDELKIYFFVQESSSILYASTRKSIDDDFSKPERIWLTGDFGGYLAAPSLTPDGKQLFVYNNPGGGNQILMFEKINNTKYELAGILNIPDGYNPSPGQFSKDGLKYYVGLEYRDENDEIHYYKRSSLSGEFTELYLVTGTLNSLEFNNMQPSLSENEEIIVFTRGHDNEWKNNNLYSAQKTTKLNDKKIDLY